MTHALTHAVITRLHYPPNDPKLAWRLAFYRTMVLPRLLNQSNQNFEVWVICHPDTVDQIKAIHNCIHIFPSENYPRPEEKRGWFDLKNFPQFDIQTGFDSDDLVSLNYIERVKQEVNNQAKDKTVVVTFQPYKLNLLNFKRYKMFERYGPGFCSMFHSVYQSKESEHRFIYEFDHATIHHWCSNIITVPEGYCDMVIHGQNWMTGLEPHLGEVRDSFN